VLRFAFPMGQALAGEPSRGALGFEGPPPGMPGFGATLSARRIEGAHHVDYWGHHDNPAATAASLDAAEFLRLGESTREVGKRRAV